MKPALRRLIPGIFVLLCGLLGWWLARDASARVTEKPRREAPAPPRRTHAPELPRSAKASTRDQFPDGATVEVFSSCNPGETILRFPSGESYGAFLSALRRSPVLLLDQLDRLHALRLGHDDFSDLADLLDEENITIYSSLSRFPALPKPGGGAAADALAFGDRVLPWLGITNPNPHWGAGVKVAVLDSGILPHPALPIVSRSIEIVPFPDDLAAIHGHGTSVASLIAGNHPMARGVAPAVELISIRVIDERGASDAFSIAAGILAAMDAGTDIMNLSLGTDADVPLIGEAIRMALEAGIVIVASSGNEGAAEARFPASYAGVISVGAVDANRRRLAFSNLGSWLSLTAPGEGVNAAWTGDRFVKTSGTSASAPLVAGAIAATMSDGSGRRLDARRAAEIVLAHTDDTGPPGHDAEYGAGILNLGRVMNRDIPHLHDAAIASQRLVPATETGGRDEIQVTIQNRGTAVLANTGVEISTPWGNPLFNVTSLAPGAIQTFSIPFDAAYVADRDAIRVTTSLRLGTLGSDLRPENNRQTCILPIRHATR